MSLLVTSIDLIIVLHGDLRKPEQQLSLVEMHAAKLHSREYTSTEFAARLEFARFPEKQETDPTVCVSVKRLAAMLCFVAAALLVSISASAEIQKLLTALGAIPPNKEKAKKKKTGNTAFNLGRSIRKLSGKK